MSLKIFLIDCQNLCLDGTSKMLYSVYPQAQILTTDNAKEAIKEVSEFQPDLLIMDIFLSEKPGVAARTHTGINLLRYLMKNYPKLNIVIQSAYINRLVQMKWEINNHNGGFTVADKSFSQEEILNRVNWAVQGLTHTREIRNFVSVNIKPEWLRLLNLAFSEGLQDKKIAQQICVSERMVRNYWNQLQQALNIDTEEVKNQGKNIRVITQIRAREEGLID